MPQKRKVSAEPGNTETKLDSSTEGPASKAGLPRRTVKSSSRKVTDNPKKPAYKRTNAVTSHPRHADSQAEGGPARATRAAAVRPESSAPAGGPVETGKPSPVSIHEQIARLAYSYWEDRGYQHGNPQEDWYRAEREIVGRLQIPKRRA